MPIDAPTCRHLHTDGRPCGSPALRGEPLCYHHHTARKPMPKRSYDQGATTLPQLPAPDDFLAIQRGIGEVLRLLAMDELTDRRAATLLRGLAIASQNLAQHHRREEKRAAQAAAAGTPLAAPVTDYTNHPTLGTLAPEAPNQTPETTPLPDPIPLFTPDRSRATAYDEAIFMEIHNDFTARFRDRQQAFEEKKSLELEALYDQRYDNLVADFETRLAQTLTQREAELRTQPQPQPQPQQETPIRIPIQQNQDLTPHPEKNLALAS